MKKKIIIVGLIVIALVISMVAFALTRKQINPEDTLKRYMSYITTKEYNAMYTLAKTSMSEEDYITRNKNIYEGIEATNIKINIAKTTKKGNKAEIVYTTIMDTIAGEVSFSNTANLEKEKDEYYINWSSSLIFPELKDEYKVRVSTIDATRGKLLDRNGTLLAGEQTASEIGLVPGKINEETKEQDIQKVASLLDVSVDSINNALSASYVKDDTFVPLKTVLKSQTDLKEQLLTVGGIKIIDSEERIYPLGEATSQLLGYVQSINAEELENKKGEGYTSNSVIGKTGLESLFENRLKAIKGAEIYITNQDGNKVKTIAKAEAKNGEDIKLTIDSLTQQKLYELFKEDKSASVAINPKTGEILAAVSTPTFNSNDFSLGITTNKWNELVNNTSNPLYNRFLASYAPGSSFKPVTGAVGLTTNSFTADDDFGRSGTKWQQDSSWQDFYITTLSTYSGAANLKNALVHSDNIYFAKAALKIGKDNFANSLKKLKFSNDVETSLGTVKSTYSNTDSFSTETSLANSGYGQAEVLVNPIHMSMVYSAFVNDGNMIQTYIEYKENAKVTYAVENAFSKEAANTIKEDLIQVVEDAEGTAHSAKIEGVTLAAKTGTAEIKESKDDANGTETGWFNAFIADENSDKQLLVISMVEDVKNRGGSHYLVNKIKTVFE